MHINDFDYNLPEELIAQHPADRRENSRLMVIDRKTGTITHKHFYDILEYLNPGDCLVMNNSKVIPARLFGIKENTGAKIEFLLIKRIQGDTWETMVKPGKRLQPGDKVSFGEDGKLKAEIMDYGEDGTRIVKFQYQGVFIELLEEIGKIPLPPYIDRESDEEDKDRYQTVYCKEEGSVAAPTAGLHFTKELLDEAVKKGIKLAYVTLHVGIGTFRPVKCDIVEEHKMHFEEYEIDEENAEIINSTKKAGGRVISVGTTSTRTVESAAKKPEPGIGFDCKLDAGAELDCKLGCGGELDYKLEAARGNTDIFIYPGYEFKIIDSLITNFHLPKSTLLMLISALYNRESMLKAYEEAVDEKYRFFSYGDAMIII